LQGLLQITPGRQLRQTESDCEFARCQANNARLPNREATSFSRKLINAARRLSLTNQALVVAFAAALKSRRTVSKTG
jgi:hypothetical protein